METVPCRNPVKEPLSDRSTRKTMLWRWAGVAQYLGLRLRTRRFPGWRELTMNGPPEITREG